MSGICFSKNPRHSKCKNPGDNLSFYWQIDTPGFFYSQIVLLSKSQDTNISFCVYLHCGSKFRPYNVQVFQLQAPR
jgi:hypothetical protein